MAKKEICLSIPLLCAIPTFYEEAGQQDIALALQLGAEAVIHLKGSAMEKIRNETHSESVKHYEGEVAAVKREAAKEREKVEELLRKANQSLRGQEQTLQEYREKCQKEARASTLELVAMKDKQIYELREELARSMDSMGRKFDTLHNSLVKTLSSSKEKGELGEGIMEDLIKKAYDCDVSIISRGRETADIRMTRAEGAYFWEVKNYTRMVSKEEVEKFKRDLRLHPDVRGGILVSLNQGIVGKTRAGDIDLEFLEDGRFILYLSHLLKKDDVIFYLQTLRPFLECMEQKKHVAEETSDLQQKSRLILTLMRSHEQSIMKHKNSITGHKARIAAMFTEFQAYLSESESQVRTLLRVAVGSEDEMEGLVSDTSATLPLQIFSKDTLAAYSEKEREFVRWILEVCKVNGDGEIQIIELIGKGKGSGFSEKFVRGARECFQEGAWKKGAQVIRGLSWI
uniref:Restriction endonuclease type IV Mrr domain-containing protein n=1 Tax=viral metagenome TaxID=1070528 RepID=A0A6C0BJC3_9ZZZZ